MGRIDATIPDDLEAELRLKIVERLGGKKGDLQMAVEHAIRLWIEEDVIRELEETATSEANTPVTHDKAIDVLEKMGRVALPALSRISHNPNCTVVSRDRALKAMTKILRK